MYSRSSGANLSGFNIRLAQVCFLIVLSLLGTRVYYLQIFAGARFHDLSENNRTRRIRLAAPRGVLFDREKRELVSNRPSYDISLMLEDIEDLDAVLKKLSEISGETVEVLKARIEREKRIKRRFEPKVLLADVSRGVLARIIARAKETPGVIVQVAPERAYPYNEVATQVFGYARAITADELKANRGKGYLGSDVIGKTGIEKQWEDVLRGEHGTELVEVDAMGAYRGSTARVEPVAGKDLLLTLDLDLQRVAQASLAGAKGTIVALNPQTGDVLAMASSPALDGNLLTGAISAETWGEITGNKELPMSNRSISAAYPPGSTFKLYMAVGGMARGLINHTSTMPCPGYFYFAGRQYHCHKKGGHGTISLQDALTLSCNAYFFRLGNLMEIDEISTVGSEFGFGQTTGINLAGERAGVMPSREWKRRTVGERWYPGDTLPVSVGQGYLIVTPLQQAVALSALVNGGRVLMPRLVSESVNPLTGEVTSYPAELKRTVTIDPVYLDAVRELAVSIVGHPRGTGKRAKIEGINIGGKTGTAQVSSLETGNTTHALRDHAWFVSYAPVEAPEIVVVAFVENAGVGGGVAAAPRARAVLEEYFIKTGRLPADYQRIVLEPIDPTTAQH